MRMKEGETRKDKDREIKSENEDSWQLWLRLCLHKLLQVAYWVRKESHCQVGPNIVWHLNLFNCSIILNVESKRPKSN